MSPEVPCFAALTPLVALAIALFIFPFVHSKMSVLLFQFLLPLYSTSSVVLVVFLTMLSYPQVCFKYVSLSVLKWRLVLSARLLVHPFFLMTDGELLCSGLFCSDARTGVVSGQAPTTSNRMVGLFVLALSSRLLVHLNHS